MKQVKGLQQSFILMIAAVLLFSFAGNVFAQGPQCAPQRNDNYSRYDQRNNPNYYPAQYPNSSRDRNYDNRSYDNRSYDNRNYDDRYYDDRYYGDYPKAPSKAKNIGLPTIIGAIGGAAIGGKKGALIGAGAGAVTGVIIYKSKKRNYDQRTGNYPYYR